MLGCRLLMLNMLFLLILLRLALLILRRSGKLLLRRRGVGGGSGGAGIRPHVKGEGGLRMLLLDWGSCVLRLRLLHLLLGWWWRILLLLLSRRRGILLGRWW